MNASNYTRGVMVMILSTILFSFMAFLTGLVDGIGFFRIGLYRFGVGAVTLATLALVGKIELKFVNKKVLLLRGTIGGIAVILFFMSMQKLGIAIGTVVSFTYPIFATVGSVVFLKEKVHPLVWLILVAATAGIFLITPSSNAISADPETVVWFVLSLIGAVASGVAVVCIKKLTRTDSSYAIFMAQCAIGFWIVAVPANATPITTGWSDGMLLVAIGMVAVMGQLTMTWSYNHIPVSTGSLLSMITPIFNVFIGVLLFQEILSAREITGAVLVLACCTGTTVLGKRVVQPPMTE